MAKLVQWLLIFGVVLPIYSHSFPARYEKLRSRYLEDFFLSDSLAGGGIPVARIREKACGHAYYVQQTCPAAMPASGANLWEWSDGTVHLGFHFFTFAVELDYLRKHGEDISSTLTVLASGFQALVRLEDVAANQHQAPASPGFLARDDAQFSTLTRWKKKGCVKSQWLCDSFQGRQNAMSQDQLIYLIWGLDAVRHAAGEHLVLPGDTISLSHKANFWIKRLLDRAQSHDWRILDLHEKKVRLGSQMWFWAWPMMPHTSDPQTPATAIAQWLLWKGLMALPYLPETPLHHEVNTAMQLVLCSFEKRFNPRSLILAKSVQMEIFPASAWWKNSKTGLFPLWNTLDSLINTIPEEGPNYLTEASPIGWRGENRWFHPDRNAGVHWEKDCRFNGLDGMALILLHAILAPQHENSTPR